MNTKINKIKLIEKYWDNKKSLEKIGNDFNLKRTTIYYYFKKFNISRRDRIQSIKMALIGKKKINTEQTKQKIRNSIKNKIKNDKEYRIKILKGLEEAK